MQKIFLVLMMMFSSLLFANDGILTSKDAFKTTLTQDKSVVKVNIELAKGVYLYNNKITVKVKPSNYVVKYSLPKPQKHEMYGEVDQVYFNTLAFDAKILKKEGADAKNITVTLGFQGCSEAGLCYAPETRELKVNLNAKDVETSTAKTTIDTTSDDSAFASALKEGMLTVIVVFFLGGVVLAFTPCVFPMIPILSGIIISQGEKITTMKAFLLSVVYVLAMAVAYTTAGVLAGLFGANLQETMQNPVVIVGFSLVFVALALSMFGFYELKMPQFIQNAVTRKSQEAEGNGYVGVAIMGFLSALIVGPCMAAPLLGALTFIGDTGDAVLGGVALFALSIGMGLPLIVVGIGAGKFMPKPGGWMDMVTAVFGVVMLMVAIWMLDRVVSEATTMLLLGSLLIISSVAFGTFEPGANSTGLKRFFKGFGIVVFLFGVSYFVGGLTKGSLYDPLKTFSTPASVVSSGSSNALDFTKKVSSEAELDALLKEVKGKKVMLDFKADWCASCKEFDEGTYQDPAVIAKMKEYVLVTVDITTMTDDIKALETRLKVRTAPAMRFFDEKGVWVEKFNIDFFLDAKKFLKVLEK